MGTHTAEQLFWELVEPILADPAASRSTMIGLACVRLDGRFFASLDRRTGSLLVKLPTKRVAQLVAAGIGNRLPRPGGCSGSGWPYLAPIARDGPPCWPRRRPSPPSRQSSELDRVLRGPVPVDPLKAQVAAGAAGQIDDGGAPARPRQAGR
jgi:hypothetical protein